MVNNIIPEKNIVYQKVTITLKDYEKKDILSEIVIAVGYVVEDFSIIVKISPEKKFTIPSELDINLRSLSLSTCRGVFYTKLMGSYLQNAILPIINIQNPIIEPNDKK